MFLLVGALIVGLIVGLIGMFVCRKWPMMALLILPLLAWGGVREITEINHLYADEVINAKAGMNLRHILIFYPVIAASAVLVIIGAFQGWRRRKLAVSH